MKFSKFVLVASFLAISAESAHAGPNLLVNGSFESGLSNWVLAGTTAKNPAAAIVYGAAMGYPYGAYGEAVPKPTAVSPSPDAAGTRGVYFVDDHAVNESLTQSVFLAAGNYEVGFEAYAPANGYANPIDAMFTAQIAGLTLADFAVSTLPSTTWLSYSGLVSIANSGMYSASFLFNTPGLGTAKDLVIDQAFIIATKSVAYRLDHRSRAGDDCPLRDRPGCRRPGAARAQGLIGNDP